ncbi:unconventional myosin-IXb-like isoform X1 [Labeo rohita]|uniref:Unconventional myosin-IXb-like isoform X1 n=1 Tax=Labeo rohita TaxID=84645 RepID=A0A498NPF0_LABRO|nr:unconventional myosin-IXb-like isoform X1 [Labeo rohita]
MNVMNGKATSCQDEMVYTLQIYPRFAIKAGQSCILSVPKVATAASVIKTALATLGLDASKSYVLVEVQESGGEEWVLQASDQPVQRVLLWPRKAQDKHPQSDGYFFALQEGSYDGSIQYDIMASVRQEKVAQGLVNRGFVTRQPQEYDDLCTLPELTEESILGTLRHRFHKQKIYTFARNILIAVNPFKFLPIYNPRYVKMYENHTLGKLEPHVFAIADTAFHTMLNKRVNQCIVISGESGSGKTQSTNFLIHCLTALSQKGYTSGVERTILGAGPVLEAFGNAKTAYNNNSSRFGKFIQVNYLESGVVRGAVVEKYLLEKCRLVSRGKTERNYHVFYYLLIGASEEEKDEFKLLLPEDYHYLKEEIPISEDQAEMKHEFRRLHQAMEMVGFLPPTKKQIFSVLSAILYLGNVTYKPKDAGEGLEVGPDHVLSAISDLLKVKVELLVEALTTRKAMTANDRLILPYSLNEAITARDSMAKSLYSALFDWIVLRINHALLNKRDLEESVPEEYMAEGIPWHNIDYPDNIGCISLFSKKPTGLFYLLDEESNFPQATDSTLLEKFKQQHQDNPFFVQTPVREPAFVIQHFAGKVKYQIKDFREKNTDHMRPDIVALLRSSECSYLRQLIGANPVAVFRWGILRATIRTLAVFNEAGRSWAQKHPDQIRRYSRRSLGEMRRPSTLVERLKSQKSLIEFSFDRSEEGPLEAFEDIFASFENKKRSRPNRHKQLIPKNLIDSHSLKFIMGLTQHNRANRSLLHLHTKKKPPSISAQFQASLSKLLETLRKAEPFFVRCIRSNGEKREMHFDDALVLQQLRYTGMLQTVRIRRSGYGAKFTFKEFTDQFRVLLPKERSTPQQDITNLLTKMGLPSSSFQIGRTKVFLKESERQILQEALHKEVMRRIIILQRWFRACLMRKQYLRKREGIITLQRSWRYLRETYRSRAAIVIQTAWRRSKEREEYLKRREKLKGQTSQTELGQVNKTEAKRPSQPKQLPQLPDESRTPDRKKNEELRPQLNTETKPKVPIQPARITKQLSISEDKPVQDDKGRIGKKERQPSPGGLPRPVSLPLNMSQSGSDETQNAVHLQRNNRTTRLKEKPEKWKERSSDAAHTENSAEILRIQSTRKSHLRKCGISQSLDNVSRVSSSESDSSASSSRNEIQSPTEADGCMISTRRASDVVIAPPSTPESLEYLTISGSQSHSSRVKNSATFPGPRRNPTIKISRATRVQEKWNASLDREITDSNELRHLDEFLGNQMNDLSTRTKALSDTEKIYFEATTQFRDTIKSMYSISNHNIGYKDLMSGYQTRVTSLAGVKKASEVPLVVNLFQSVLDGFIRGELKRLEMEPCKKEGEQTLHFGVPVCVLVRQADSVPFVMEKMLVHVEMNGLYTEGIYRKSGSACRAKELHHLLEKDPQSVSLDNYPIHTITGLVKQWLRELPDPLMTYSLYNDFVYAADLPEASERLRAIYRKLDELPPSNFSTLERLIFHLVKVLKEEAHNRMSANALAIVFAPCILRCPDSSDPLLSMKDINKTTLCVEILINEQTRRYNQKMGEIQELENAEAMAIKQLKLRRQNTIFERPKYDSDTFSLDRDELEIEKNLIERIKSLKKEKNDLAFRLPEFDQDSSDAENMDSESLVSSESLLEDHFVSLDSEANIALNSSKPEKPAKPPDPTHDPKTGSKQPAEERNQSRSASRRDGVQSMCVIQSQDVPESLASSISAGNQGKRRFSELDIPFIDEDE